MPIVDRNLPSLYSLASGALQDVPDVAGPGFWDTLGAAWRQENIIGSGSRSIWNFAGVDNRVDSSYDPWQDIKGTPYEEHWERFAQSNNAAYSGALKAQIDSEERDRHTLAESGMFGVLASIGSSILDPTILIPVGGEIAKIESGYRIARSALSLGVVGGVSAGIQEFGLQSTQETRPIEDSYIAVGAGVVLGGLLGGTLAAVMTKAERTAAARGYDELLTGESSAGAMQTSRLTEADLTVSGGAANATARATQFISPNMRLNFSDSVAARELGQTLTEGTMYQGMHTEGRTIGASVETLAKVNYRARLATAIKSHRDIFKEMKQSGVKMSLDDFENAIGRAMRAEDVGENDFVSRAAKAWRESIVSPYFNEAKAAGIFEDGDEAKFAASYFPRQYKTKVLIANEHTIKPEWQAFMESRIKADYAEQAAHLRERAASAQQEIADLKLSPDERAATLADLEKKGDLLDQSAPHHVDRRTLYNETRAAAGVAKEAGDNAKAAQLLKDAKRIHDEGGASYTAFLKERGGLRARHRRVDLNYAGLEDRQQRVLNRLAEVSNANERGLRRLVTRGRVIEREMGRLDGAKLTKRLSGLKTDFARVLRRSEAAQDRIAKAAADLGATAPAEMAARLEQEAAAETARHARLTSLAERIEKLERLDPERAAEEMKSALDDLVGEVSDVSMRRGEQAARLKERAAKLDPKRLDERIATVTGRSAEDMRKFLDRFEIGRLGQGVDPLAEGADVSFADMAKQIVDDVFDKLTGRDYGSSASVAPEYMTPVARGPIKERTLPIPDEMLQRQGVLQDNVVDVMHRYARVVGADTELTNRFGSPTLVDQIGRIRDEYRVLREAAKENPKELARLTARERADVRDVQALRDLIRGTYKAKENASGFGRVVRGLTHFNYIRSMGGAVVASISDLYRPAMVHGLGAFMGEGIAPLLTNVKAVKMAVKEAQLAGQVTERVLQQRIVSLGEIADPMSRGAPIERFLENTSKIASKWNGIQHWTDGVKSITSILSQNRILDGKADKRMLAFLGIDEDMSRRIGAEFTTHGEVLDGVHVANTESWTDANAVRAFRAAVSKDVDSIIVTPGVGDVPLFSHTPMGRILLQFRSFMFAAHQRVLLRGLQEGKARFLSGLVGMTSLGILAATLKAWRGGSDRWEKFKEASSNPGYLIGEGLDNSGVFTLPMDFANTTEKLTQATGFSFNPLKTPMMAAGQLAAPGSSMQGSSVRFQTRSPLSTLLGPTAGAAENLFAAAGAPVSAIQGEDVKTRQRNAALSLVPFNSYLGMRELLQAFEGDSPYAPQEQ